MTRLALGPEETVRLARASGAVPILAHPHTIQVDDEENLGGFMARLATAGLVGVEVLYPGYDRKRRKELSTVAERIGLLVSGGSDYHGTYKVHNKLGAGYDDVVVPESVLEDLRAQAG
jgi:predicted metal-dependent phosphoesterase TrpH